MYPADSLRNVDFLRRMGHVPSIMDYARFHYVAQPEDNIPVDLLIPRIGPYDKFAIKWGYRPVPGVKSSAEARAVLDQWAREQDEKPWLRFSTSDRSGAVVGEQTEAVGDADVVYSTRLGLKNIRRIVPMIVSATVREGEDFSDLREVYGVVINQWTTELKHVISMVGGVEGQEKYGGQEGVRFQLVPAARQKEAVAFLNEEAFKTPTYLLDPEIMRRIEVKGTMDRVSRAQASLLGELMHRNRLGRMLEFEALARKGEKVYTAAEFLGDLRRGLWRELSLGSVKIDAMRRDLQHAYLDQIDAVLNPGSTKLTGTLLHDIRGLYRRELRQLDASIRDALPRAGDELTRLHLETVRVRIARILDPK